MNKFYIFLDFDGVLFINNLSDEPLKNFSLLMNNLNDLNLDIHIIFSTSWREYKPTQELIKFLPKDTHHFKFDKTIHIQPHCKNIRMLEINDYLVNNNINETSWIAIDDMKVLFPENVNNVFFTESSLGITKKNILDIKNKIIEIQKNPIKNNNFKP